MPFSFLFFELGFWYVAQALNSLKQFSCLGLRQSNSISICSVLCLAPPPKPIGSHFEGQI
jgi:hypothetical protein